MLRTHHSSSIFQRPDLFFHYTQIRESWVQWKMLAAGPPGQEVLHDMTVINPSLILNDCIYRSHVHCRIIAPASSRIASPSSCRECALVSWGGMKMSIPSQPPMGWANKRVRKEETTHHDFLFFMVLPHKISYTPAVHIKANVYVSVANFKDRG